MKENTMDKFADRFFDTLSEIANQIKIHINSLSWNEISNSFNQIIQVNERGNKVFVYGAGRSGFIGRCFAQRLMHIGISSCFISDAVTYRYTEKDLLIIISGSGETPSPLAISKRAKEIGGELILITSNPQSSIGQLADIIIYVNAKSKDKAISESSLAPYTSLFDISALSILDAIGAILMLKLGFTEVDIDKSHASLE